MQCSGTLTNKYLHISISQLQSAAQYTYWSHSLHTEQQFLNTEKKKVMFHQAHGKELECQQETICNKSESCCCLQPTAFSSRFLSDYEVIKCLGSGGFGVVLEARDKLVDISYAVKRIPLPTETGAKEKVMREVKNHARLGHQHIVRYYVTWLECPPPGWQVRTDHLLAEKTGTDIGAFVDQTPDDESDSDFDFTTPEGLSVEEGSSSFIEFWQSAVQMENFSKRLPLPRYEPREFLYIAMELCCGGTLKKWLYDNQKKRMAGVTTKMFRQICSGVAYIHKQGLIHRDLKPDNIYFSASGLIKIGDFGLSTRLRWSSSGELGMMATTTVNLSHHVGTRMYMAPEVGKSSVEYNNKVDIYSLGIILLELLTPISTESELYEVAAKAKRCQFPSSVRFEWQSLLYSMLFPNPVCRPDAKEILQSSPKTPKSKVATPQRARKKRLAIMVGGGGGGGRGHHKLSTSGRLLKLLNKRPVPAPRPQQP